MQTAGPECLFFPSPLAPSPWNMGTNCLYEVEAGEKGQGVLSKEQHNCLLTWQLLLLKRFRLLRVGSVGGVRLD